MKLAIELGMGMYFGAPQIRLAIDDYMLLYDGPAQTTFEFDISLDDGNHELKIIHYGKSPADHLLDDQGRIIQDKFVEILGITMDGVQLEKELWTARFFPVYMHKADHEPYFISPNLYLGHNGSWILDFSTPALTWLIGQRQLGPSLDNTIFKTSREVLLEMKQAFSDLPDV